MLENYSKNLLQILIDDEKKINKSLYSAGPYWDYKCKKIYNQICKKSLHNFRGLNSGVGTSYCDNIVLDIRNELGLRGRLLSFFLKGSLNPSRKLFDLQVSNSQNYINLYLELKSHQYRTSDKVKDLIKRYNISDSVEYGCVDKFNYLGNDYSSHYIEIANDISFLEKFHNFRKISSFFEIGGGFGSKVHFLLKNFPNIKKIIYLDIVPNIFVGTEYLRKFFKYSVVDYLKTRDLDSISFSNNNDLEILCLPVWEIEKLSVEMDYFHNSHSFVEMPQNVVENYYRFIKKNMKINSSFSLISYLGFDLNTTYDPSLINKIFENLLNVNYFTNSTEKKKNIFLIK
jgi:putative sugar O-methyltransferase